MEPAESDEPAAELIEAVFGEGALVIRRYVDLLLGPGVERGLIGPREAPRVWQRHILNCAVVESCLPRGVDLLDLGSGAGLPGVVLAVARPDVRVTLLEPMARRAQFLSEVVAELGLGNAVVHSSRAEELPGEVSFSRVTARAVAPLPKLLRWALPLTRAGGEVLALKGSAAEAELAAAGAVLRRLHAGRASIVQLGTGVVAPPTTVVRIESSGRRGRTIAAG